MNKTKFGSWTVISIENNKMLFCRCICGIEKSVNKYNLRNGKSTSCGCVTKSLKAKKHGLSNIPEYQTWKSIKQRCYNKNHKNYPDYGGRGITVCSRWLNNFQAFYNDMGDKPSPNHSIDRANNNLDYSPSNCRWATQKEQTRNTRRSKKITLNGATKTVAEWAEITGIKSSTIYHRLAAGWNDEQALSI